MNKMYDEILERRDELFESIGELEYEKSVLQDAINRKEDLLQYFNYWIDCADNLMEEAQMNNLIPVKKPKD